MSGKLRLLICHTCRSIQEIPDFQGRPEDDVLLEHLLVAHRFPDGNEHFGKLAEVLRADWEDSVRKAAIIEQIKAAVGGTTGMPSEWYATKDTYAEDALKCYAKHGRPKEGCIDYCDSSKRIQNPSRAGWEGGPRVWLCNFCPVESYIQMRENHLAGMYKEGK